MYRESKQGLNREYLEDNQPSRVEGVPQLETPLRAKCHPGIGTCNYIKVWTQKFGQRLSMECGVDVVLLKLLYVKIAFIATFLITQIEC